MMERSVMQPNPGTTMKAFNKVKESDVWSRPSVWPDAWLEHLRKFIKHRRRHYQYFIIAKVISGKARTIIMEKENKCVESDEWLCIVQLLSLNRYARASQEIDWFGWTQKLKKMKKKKKLCEGLPNPNGISIDSKLERQIW